MKYYFADGVRFEELTMVLRIFKRQGLSKTQVLDLFSAPENLEEVNASYDSLLPISVKEAIALNNAEQRMVALRSIDLAEIKSEMQAELINSQTITKKQIRWDEQLKPYEREFKDTYELYKIPPKKIGIATSISGIYFVRCQCATTDRTYFLYVAPEVGEKKDAIEAIAWTMRIEGKPLNKKQYLSLLYSES